MSPVCFAPDSGGGGGASTPPPWGETKVVGARLPRVDAYERVSGSAVFTLDLQLPGMLHVAIVRCPHAHARVKRIDTAKAEAMPGVRGVLTGESPGAAIPWYQGREGPLSLLFDPHCRHEGEEVAAVAADTALQAHDAARAVVVEYEELPFVVDPDKALAPDAPKVHDWGNLLGQPRVTTRGDVAAGFAAADAVVEMTFRTPVQMHTPMEVHVSVAQWDGDRAHGSRQHAGRLRDPRGLAGALKLPLASVRVVGHYMGGGFGSKLELGKYTVIAALLARRLGRPVKAALTREETFLVAGNRPSNVITLKAGAKRDGTLAALEARLSGPVGAYPTSAVSAYQIGDLYTCPNVKFETTNILIHAGKARPFRAPGFPSCNWALEQVVDTLAEKLGLDPVELRLKNIPAVSQLNDNAPYTSTGLARCLAEGAKAFGWTEARRRPKNAGHLRRGVGVAAGMWGYGGDPNATAIVTLYADGSVNLNTGASDLGTGTKTCARDGRRRRARRRPRPHPGRARRHRDHQVRAVLGRQPDRAVDDSPAVRAAAIEVKRQVLEIAARAARQSRSATSPSPTAPWSSPARRDEGCRFPGSSRGSASAACWSGWHAPPPPGGQARPAVRRPVRRGRGRHEERRGAGAARSSPPRTRAGHEPPDLRQPGLRGRHPGAGVRPHRGAGARPRPRQDGQRQPGTTTRSRRSSTHPPRPSACRSTRTTSSATRWAPRGWASRRTSRRRRRSPTPSSTPRRAAARGAGHPGAPRRRALAAPPVRRRGGRHAARFAYVRPRSLKDAVAELSTPGARVHAGGTDLLGCLRDRVFTAERVVA